MKKAKFIIPFAAAILLAGCGAGGDVTSSSSDAVSETTTSSSETSETVSETSDTVDSESSESQEPAPAIDEGSVTIDKLTELSDYFAKKVSSVSGGTINYKTKDSYSDDTKLSNYSYGSDDNGETLRVNSGAEATYVMKDKSGAILTILKDKDGKYRKADSSDLYKEVAPHFTDYLESYDSYGVEGMLSDVVKAAKKNPNGDFSATNDGSKVKFSFSYFEGSDPLTVYKVSVNFDCPTTYGPLTYVNFTFDQYGSDSFLYDEDNRTATINKDGTISRTDTYTIRQTAGARTYTNDFDFADFAHKGISIYNLTWDNEGNAVKTEIDSDKKPLPLEKGDYASILIADTNKDANVDFDPLTWTVTSGDADGISGYISHGNDGDIFNLKADKSGDYVVEIANSSKTVKGSFKVSVSPVKVTSISASLLSVDMNNEVNSKALNDGDTINAYTDIDVNFSFSLDPYNGGIDDLTIGVFDENWEAVDSEDYTIDTDAKVGYNEDEVSCVSFCTSKEGTYWFRVSSKVDEDVKKDFQIVVADSLDFASILTAADTYGVKDSNGTRKYTFVFTPDADDDCKGSVVITDLEDSTKSVTTDYVISKGEEDYDWYGFKFTEDVGISGMFIGEDRALYVQLTEDDSTYYRLEDTSSISYAFDMHWSASCDKDGYEYNKVDYLDFYDDGTVYGQITSQDETYSLKCEYTIVHDGQTYYTITFIEGDGSKIEEPEYEWFSELPKTASLDTDTGLSINADALNLNFLLTSGSNS